MLVLFSANFFTVFNLNFSRAQLVKPGTVGQSWENITGTRSLAGGRSTLKNRLSNKHTQLHLALDLNQKQIEGAAKTRFGTGQLSHQTPAALMYSTFKFKNRGISSTDGHTISKNKSCTKQQSDVYDTRGAKCFSIWGKLQRILHEIPSNSRSQTVTWPFKKVFWSKISTF